MIYKRIYFIPENTSVYLDTYAVPSKETAPKDAILVVPGGGYHKVCVDREGESIALAYNAQGLSAFVLKYTVPPKSKDEPLLEIAKAFAYIKKNASTYLINPERIFLIGFSAGAHLVGTLSMKYRKAEEQLALPENFLRPCGTVYCYPVVTAMCETHKGSYENLLGKPFDEISEEERREYSNELLVSENTPPAFIWHTANDSTVPVYGSLLLAESYARASVPVELHIYPKGPHGISLAMEHTSEGRADFIDERISRWFSLSVEWMKTVS